MWLRLKTVRRRDPLRLLGRSQGNHTSPQTQKIFLVYIRDNSMGLIQPAVTGFTHGGRGHVPRSVSSLYKMEKARKKILL